MEAQFNTVSYRITLFNDLLHYLHNANGTPTLLSFMNLSQFLTTKHTHNIHTHTHSSMVDELMVELMVETISLKPVL